MPASSFGGIAKERDRANREAAASQRVADFMTRMFKVSDPNEGRGNAVTAREILDKGSKEIDAGLANDPELQARLLYVMGAPTKGSGSFHVRNRCWRARSKFGVVCSVCKIPTHLLP